jgi:hypothetical protein
LADHIQAASTFTTCKNMHTIGFAPRANTITPFTANSDLVFWGKRAYQGHYNGFRILNIGNPTRPTEIVFQGCLGDQGDVVVWDKILIRSWNSPAPAGATCDGQLVPEGFEGVHVFDISNEKDPGLGQPRGLRQRGRDQRVRHR